MDKMDKKIEIVSRNLEALYLLLEVRTKEGGPTERLLSEIYSQERELMDLLNAKRLEEIGDML